MTKNAIPAHHKLSVRNQTTTATRAAGINMNSRRMTRIISRPIMTKPTSPKRPEPIRSEKSNPGKSKTLQTKMLAEHK